MKVLFCEPSGDCLETIREAVRVLRAGGVLVHPTDTCYGLAVDIMNPDAIERLYKLKDMPLPKPVSILVRSLEEGQRYGEFSELALRMAEEFWPGPLTLVVPRKDAVPSHLNPGAQAIGIRVIDEPVSVALLEAFGSPLTTTSANAHKKPSPYLIEDVSVEADLAIDVGYLLQHDKPSTVIQVEERKATTLRQGDLFEIYGRVAGPISDS